MVDDYVAYKALFTARDAQGPATVIELGCMAHARRKFFELHAANGSPIAFEALTRIAALYEIERRAKQCNAEDRQTRRLSEAMPLLASMKAWLLQTRTSPANGGALARASDYSLRRWVALSRYAESGHLPLDNNPIENAIRAIAIGKKIGCSPVASVRVNAQRPFKASSPRPRKTGSIRSGPLAHRCHREAAHLAEQPHR